MRNTIFIFLCLLGWIGSQAQSNHLVETFGNVYRQYIFETIKDFPAPKGYRPIYISHIGRHGSRYPVSKGYVRNGMDILLLGDSLGILTADGKALLRAYIKMDSICSGQYGMLCERGIQEHKKIAERMYNRFSPLFSQSGRKRVNVSSTDLPRAIVSGANFCTALASLCPGADFHFVAGPMYYNLLCNDTDSRISANNKAGALESDRYMDEHFPYDTFYGRLFSNPQEMYARLKTKRLLAESTFSNGTVAAYLGLPDILDRMSPKEYQEASIAYTNKMYFNHCNGRLAGSWRVHFMDSLLADVVSKADEAITTNSNMLADLRFSHDTGMMPFFSLIGIEGYDKALDFDDSYKFWDSSALMCMATNLQMIFYANKQNDILETHHSSLL